jgi:ribonuclease P protein component
VSRQQDGQKFGPALRVKTRPEFLKLQETGVKVSADCVLAVALRNDSGQQRLGLTVSSKVGPSVVRNRIRRRLRELFRKRRHELPEGIDLVLIARSSAAEADFARLSRAFGKAAAELKKKFPA